MRTFLVSAIAVAATASAFATDFPGGDLRVISSTPIGEAMPPMPRGTLTDAYSNITTFLASGFAPGGAASQSGNIITKMVMDDVTFGTPAGLSGRPIEQVVFSVFNGNTTAVSVRARIRFWVDNAGVPGAYLDQGGGDIGFTFNPLSFAANTVTTVTGNVTVAPPGIFNLPASGTLWWCGLTCDNNTGATGATLAQMNNFGAGLFDPPTVGTSEDVGFVTTAAGSFFQVDNPAGQTFNFAGDPIANFGWAFRGTPVGGCCVAGNCQTLSADDCTAAGGSYLGAGVACSPTACSASCVGDVNGDGVIDLSDLTALLSGFGSGTGDPSYNAAADFDHNGLIDLSDLTTLLSAFGTTC